MITQKIHIQLSFILFEIFKITKYFKYKKNPKTIQVSGRMSAQDWWVIRSIPYDGKLFFVPASAP